LQEFSESILPIAAGIKSLAQVDTESEYVKVVDLASHGSLKFPIANDVGPDGRFIVALNPRWYSCGCNMPEGMENFGQRGLLSFKAVVLGVSKDNKVTLALVFAQRGVEHGYTVITIERTGYSSNHNHTPSLNEDGYLKYSLGLIPAQYISGHSSFSGGSMSMYLGFPDSDRYLAEHIGELGPYLTAMAVHTMSEHKK